MAGSKSAPLPKVGEKKARRDRKWDAIYAQAVLGRGEGPKASPKDLAVGGGRKRIVRDAAGDARLIVIEDRHAPVLKAKSSHGGPVSSATYSRHAQETKAGHAYKARVAEREDTAKRLFKALADREKAKVKAAKEAAKAEVRLDRERQKALVAREKAIELEKKARQTRGRDWRDA